MPIGESKMTSRVGQTISGLYCDVQFKGKVERSWKRRQNTICHSVILDEKIYLFGGASVRTGIIVLENEILKVEAE